MKTDVQFVFLGKESERHRLHFKSRIFYTKTEITFFMQAEIKKEKDRFLLHLQHCEH